MNTDNWINFIKRYVCQPKGAAGFQKINNNLHDPHSLESLHHHFHHLVNNLVEKKLDCLPLQ